MSGRKRKKLLSCSSHGSVPLEGRPSRGGTVQSEPLELVEDLNESPSPVLQLFMRPISDVKDNASLRDEETIHWFLLLSKDKGKNR